MMVLTWHWPSITWQRGLRSLDSRIFRYAEALCANNKMKVFLNFLTHRPATRKTFFCRRKSALISKQAHFFSQRNLEFVFGVFFYFAFLWNRLEPQNTIRKMERRQSFKVTGWSRGNATFMAWSMNLLDQEVQTKAAKGNLAISLSFFSIVSYSFNCSQWVKKKKNIKKA